MQVSSHRWHCPVSPAFKYIVHSVSYQKPAQASTPLPHLSSNEISSMHSMVISEHGSHSVVVVVEDVVVVVL